jgi:cytidylate kinase
VAIITISRELAALGDEIAAELAKLLDYRFVDKNTLEKRIKSFGVESTKLERYDERKPSLWASLSQDRDDYLHYLKTTMLTEAKTGDSVFMGRGAAAIFKNVPGVLSIFLITPMDIRIERVKSYFHCDDKKAKQIIERSDHDREGFHRYFFDMEWKAPEHYHLTLNTGHLHPAVCAEMIKRLRDYFITEEAEGQHLARLEELMLAQEIKHRILYEKELPIHFLEVSVFTGKVVLYGVANSQALVDATISAAAEVGVKDASIAIRSEIQVVQEYSIVP